MNTKEMKISKQTLDGFCDYLSKNMGLSFSRESLKGIEMKIASIVHAFGREQDPENCLIEIIESPVNKNLISKLAPFLSVGETYFFRDSSFFALLENKIIPDLIKRKQSSRNISIWSSGCATGEEPYSIAILLHRLIYDLDNWNIRVIGSDINPKFLQRAEKAIYKKWSFRTISEEMQKLYFEKIKNDQWILKPEIRGLVKFYYVNLVDTLYPETVSGGSFDLIICNNVLIYFTSEKINQTVGQLSNCLVEGGWLCVTAIEVPYIQEPNLIPCYFGNHILFKKSLTPRTESSSHFSLTPLQSSSDRIYNADLFTKKIEENEIFAKPKFNIEGKLAAFTAPVKKEQAPQNEVQASEIAKASVNKDTRASGKEELAEINDAFAEIEKEFKASNYNLVIEKIEKLLEQCQGDNHQLKKYLSHIHLLIHAYANQKNLEQALQLCQKYLEINYLNPQIYCVQASILQEQSRFNEAIDSLRRALYLDSDLVIAHFELGCLYIQQKQVKEGEKYFRNALKLLDGYPPDTTLPGTEGILAGNLKSIILNKNII